ncbi:glycoside hydrolase family 13 protein [Auraticoccus monumenti]|uniref:Alpha-glucosidase n=1 Tax=Auraticoccus monumenti TaxID=675864 RepID=A0A1G6YUF0_9ACTN|nr:glycoside hydrolase family 13 protein [Auraticoccus monumenti]SDD93196.1 alpha-glucosidase [Auraticoccus monumenti]
MTDRGVRSDPSWWRQAVVYQVYPRSFADANGDGVGDLPGVLSRVDHLVSLGVDAVWFSPFYPSALSDGGYDVDDYRDVDPTIGTLDDFDAVVAALHAHGIRVIIDIVPNHSSDRHVRFQEALAAGPGSPARDRYIFRDGQGVAGELPPNDWRSFFGGPAWTRLPDGQWYLHLFTPHQPDWNWDHPDVAEDFLRTLRFWGDRGVDGFRVDVAMCLAKDLREPYAAWEVVSANLPRPIGAGGPSRFPDGAHPLLDRAELDTIYASWRQVFDSYDPPLFAVGETWVEPHRLARYSDPRGLGQAFNFDFLWNPWEATRFREVIRDSLALAQTAGTSTTWVLSNHDLVRHATRYAPSPLAPDQRLTAAVPIGPEAREQGLRRATAATMLALALPGSAYLYQGEELGLHEVTDIPAASVQDPQARLVDGVLITRDGCRVPLPWTTSGPSFGFGDAEAHLPQPEWFGAVSVQTQTASDTSTLALYRRALQLRHELQCGEELTWLDLGADVVGFRRPNGWVSVTNFGASPTALPPGEVRLTNVDLVDGLLPADASAWLVPVATTDARTS